ncbi:MAG: type II secretion system GspH family protein [Defluviitaleaceae bacterium]|nr:type II secretion system GspH family protein [Defluviitaleaceae bacterium]
MKKAIRESNISFSFEKYCFKGKNEGISLLELIIVLAILSIVIFGVINITAGDSKETELLRAASLVQSDIRYTQNRSLTYSMRHRLAFNISSNFYKIQYEPELGIWNTLRKENIYGNVFLEQESTFNESRPLSFTVRGTASGAGTIWLSNKSSSSSYRIRITVTLGAGGTNIYEIIKY